MRLPQRVLVKKHLKNKGQPVPGSSGAGLGGAMGSPMFPTLVGAKAGSFTVSHAVIRTGTANPLQPGASDAHHHAHHGIV